MLRDQFTKTLCKCRDHLYNLLLDSVIPWRLISLFAGPVVSLGRHIQQFCPVFHVCRIHRGCEMSAVHLLIQCLKGIKKIIDFPCSQCRASHLDLLPEKRVFIINLALIPVLGFQFVIKGEGTQSASLSWTNALARPRSGVQFIRTFDPTADIALPRRGVVPGFARRLRGQRSCGRRGGPCRRRGRRGLAPPWPVS